MLSLVTKQWKIKKICYAGKVKFFMEKLNISSITSKFLLSRGFIDIEKASEFININDLGFINPFMLKDMDIAVDYIIEAIKKDKKILIYGDYDVDGVTSVALLYLFFKTLTENIDYYIPNRMDDGYGLSVDSIDYINDTLKPDLIITVDCGISSHYEAEYIKALGIDLIITDHHECPELLPKGIAIINPGREDSIYPNKKLAGVGVALKLVHGIGIKIKNPNVFKDYLDIAVLGTIADLAELSDENRLIAKKGLERINNTLRIGLNELIKVSGLSGKVIKSYHIGFLLGPRINAAGRLESAEKVVRMLITDDEKLAETIAMELDKNNIQRQECQKDILEKAIEKIEKNDFQNKNKVIVIDGEDWHSGVIGIVSSKITDKYNRPSLIISTNNEEAKGSGRSIEGFNLYNALESCSDIFTKFGGHEMAAGFSLKSKDISKLRKTINEYADEKLEDEFLVPKLKIDTVLTIDEININSIEEMAILEPFGIGNPAPIFCIEGVCIVDIKKMGKNNEHIRLNLKSRNQFIEAVGFNLSDKTDTLSIGDTVDIGFSLSINEWQGLKKSQLIIKDFKKNEKISVKNNFFIKSNKKVDIILKNMDNNNIASDLIEIGIFGEDLLISRSELVFVYKYIINEFNQGLKIKSICAISDFLEEEYKIDINYFKVKHSLKVFKDLGIIDYKESTDDCIEIFEINSNKKYQLEDSDTFRKLQNIKIVLEAN